MSESTDPSEDMFEAVDSALSVAHQGDVESALLVFDSLQRENGYVLSATAIKRHEMAWLILARCSLLIDLGRNADAEVLLRSLLADTEKAELIAHRNLDQCFLKEIRQTSLMLSRALNYRGQFNDSVRVLVEALSSIAESKHVDVEDNSTELREKLSELGRTLGYEFLSEKLVRSSSTHRKENILGERKKSPVPHSGRIVGRFKSRYNRLTIAVNDAENDPIVRGAAIVNGLQVLEEWRTAVPYSCEAQELYVALKFLLAETAIEADVVFNIADELDERILELDDEIQKLFFMSSESPDLRRETSTSLYQLARTLLKRPIAGADMRNRLTVIAAKCLSGSYELLDQLRRTSPVTQAIALDASAISDLVAQLDDVLEEGYLAISHRMRRDGLVLNVLSRDQNNDSALRLASMFGVSSSDQPTEYDHDIGDVGTWNWSIEPLM